MVLVAEDGQVVAEAVFKDAQGQTTVLFFGFTRARIPSIGHPRSMDAGFSPAPQCWMEPIGSGDDIGWGSPPAAAKPSRSPDPSIPHRKCLASCSVLSMIEWGCGDDWEKAKHWLAPLRTSESPWSLN